MQSRGGGAGAGRDSERERYPVERLNIVSKRGAWDGEVDTEQSNMENLLDDDFSNFSFFTCPTKFR